MTSRRSGSPVCPCTRRAAEAAGGRSRAARTDLSGLTADEARALFLVAGPSSTATPAVRAALRKLVRALPEPLRDSAEAATRAVVVDPSGWDGAPRPPARPAPHLDALQRAVINAQEIELDYVARDRVESTRIVHPLGLAAKGTSWYLVADTDAGLRTFRADRARAVRLTGRPARRRDGFDLEAAWRMIASDIDERRASARARALVAPQLVGWLRATFGTRVRIGAAIADGRVDVELRGHSDTSLAREVAGFGALVDVVEPAAVRIELARIGAQLVDRYGAQP